MSQLSVNNYVIVTRNFGNFHVSKEKAEKLDLLFNMPENQRPYRIEIEDDTKIVFSDIIGITTATKYDEIQKRKRGQWQCSSNNWHDKFEKCQCGWGMDTVMREQIVEEKLSPEQKRRVEITKKLREKGMTLSDMYKYRSKSIEELEQML